MANHLINVLRYRSVGKLSDFIKRTLCNCKDRIIAVVVIIIIGVLVARVQYTLGLIISLCAIGVYVVAVIKRNIKILLHFKRESVTDKLIAAIWALVFLVAVMSAVRGSIPYFTMLVLFAVNYLLLDKQEN